MSENTGNNGEASADAISLNAGHVGLAVSSKAHKQLWPAATSWLAERSTPATG